MQVYFGVRYRADLQHSKLNVYYHEPGFADVGSSLWQAFAIFDKSGL